jgi:hypothetical protein
LERRAGNSKLKDFLKDLRTAGREQPADRVRRRALTLLCSSHDRPNETNETRIGLDLGSLESA